LFTEKAVSSQIWGLFRLQGIFIEITYVQNCSSSATIIKSNLYIKCFLLKVIVRHCLRHISGRHSVYVIYVSCEFLRHIN